MCISVRTVQNTVSKELNGRNMQEYCLIAANDIEPYFLSQLDLSLEKGNLLFSLFSTPAYKSKKSTTAFKSLYRHHICILSLRPMWAEQQLNARIFANK